MSENNSTLMPNFFKWWVAPHSFEHSSRKERCVEPHSTGHWNRSLMGSKILFAIFDGLYLIAASLLLCLVLHTKCYSFDALNPHWNFSIEALPQSKSINEGLGHQNHNHFYGSEPLNSVISAEGFKFIQMAIKHHGFHPIASYKAVHICLALTPCFLTNDFAQRRVQIHQKTSNRLSQKFFNRALPREAPKLRSAWSGS